MCTIHESYKIYIYIYILLNFSLLFHQKNIFSFSLSLSLSLSFSFFFSLPHLLSASLIYSRSSSSPIFIVITHVAVPRRRPISPSPPSHRSPNVDKPSPPSHCRSKLYCRPKLHRWSKLHRHRLHRTQERCGFHGWILWLWLDFVGFSGFRDGGLAGFHGGWVSWVNGSVVVLVVICVVVFG